MSLPAEFHFGRTPGTYSAAQLVSPTQAYQIILGKSTGIFLRGFAQVLILVLTSTLLFRL
jgi:hypothetical protein